MAITTFKISKFQKEQKNPLMLLFFQAEGPPVSIFPIEVEYILVLY